VFSGAQAASATPPQMINAVFRICAPRLAMEASLTFELTLA
jgi:hypothetical protein